MVVLALVLLVVGEYLASQNGPVWDANMVPFMAPFLPPSVNAAFIGYKNGTFNAA
jgi:hypothetical protein